MFYPALLNCNFDVEILEGGALPVLSLAVSPPECRLRHSSVRLKPALTTFTAP
jgi:hypothetical protein